MHTLCVKCEHRTLIAPNQQKWWHIFCQHIQPGHIQWCRNLILEKTIIHKRPITGNKVRTLPYEELATTLLSMTILSNAPVTILAIATDDWLYSLEQLALCWTQSTWNFLHPGIQPEDFYEKQLFSVVMVR